MIAVALSPKARALIQADRDALRPTAADRERVAAALRVRLGSTVLPLETPLPKRLVGNGARRSATAFGVCVVGSMLFLSRRPATMAGPAAQIRSKPVVAMLAATAEAAPREPELSNQATAAAQPTAKSQTKSVAISPHPIVPAVAAPPALDPLAEEVRLLSSAMSQLSSGQAQQALLALEEHQRRFSSGALSAERYAAKARALCALRRFSEGRAALARLSAGTPLAARAKQDCDSASLRSDTKFSKNAEHE